MSRIEQVSNQLTSNEKKNTLTVTDNRTGKTYQIPIKNNYIEATELKKIKDENNIIMRSYDPGFMNTISCTSKISYIDGDKGILEYRGYPIEQLAEKASFLEVAFLLIFGELPSSQQLKKWETKILNHTYVHDDITNLMKGFHYDSHPMGMFISTIAAIGTIHPAANPALAGQGVYKDTKLRNKQIHRILGISPTIAAQTYRHRIGRHPNMPKAGLGYVENFLYMLDNLNDSNYQSNPKLVRALEVLFILHAEHELNCSTAAVRHLASSGVDVYSTMAGGASALYGPKHGGANEAVLRMLESIGSKANIPQFIQDVKDKKKLLMGFGHRVYKNYDPRAKIVKRIADEVFEITGKEPLIEIAMELERIALSDEYFVKRKLYPNVDFYSGCIYKAMGFPTDMFVLLFTIPRMSGWLAHWVEFLNDKENNIARPFQNYVGHRKRDFVPLDKRQEFQFEFDSFESKKMAFKQ